MSGFSNPVANAVGTLIRKAMNSVNYVTGVAGWIIRRDGSAEFSNVVVRGEVDAGGSTGQARVVMTGNLPAPLNTFTWQAGSRSYKAAVIFYGIGDDTTYTYLATVQNNNIPAPGTLVHMGEVKSGAVVVDGSGNPKVTEWYYSTTGNTFAFSYNPDNFSVKLANSLSELSAGPGQVVVRSNDPGGTIFISSAGNTILNGPTVYGNNPGPVTAFNAAALTAAGTTYISLSSRVAVAFTAPPGGNVWISYHSVIHTSAAAGNAKLTPQVRSGSVLGSGAIFYGATDLDALMVTGTTDYGMGNSIPITGLTPGAQYNVELMGASSGTGTFAQNKVSVIPIF